MNNRWYKKLLLLLTVGCMTVSMTGCSADSVLDKLLSVTDPKPDKKTETTKEDSSDKKDSAGEKEVEVAKPEFTTNLSGAVTYAVNAKASALTVEATTTDDGSITYQWYKSQTDSIQHSSCGLCYTGCRISRPRHICHAFCHDCTKIIQVYKFTIFRTGTKCSRRSHYWIFQSHSCKIYAHFAHNSTSVLLNTGPSLHTRLLCT